MAEVTCRGFAKPDDPIYSTGPVIGGKHFGTLWKNGKLVSPQETEPPPEQPVDQQAKPEKT